MKVWLIKPSIDTRDGAGIIKSRIGLKEDAQVITPEQDIVAEYHKAGKYDVIISDESQFFTPEQIDQLRTLVDEEDLPVLCFGLRTDFLTHFSVIYTNFTFFVVLFLILWYQYGNICK